MLSYVSLFFRRLKNSFILRFLLLMVTAFILGSMLGVFTGQIPRSQKTSSAAQSTGWGLSFQEEGKRPAGNASIDDLKQYNAYYASDTDQKIIYLTFDAGYENGNTPAILDALKKHQAPAVFFVVGNFIKDNPDLIRRILADDHIIGNHTMTHPDLPQISSMDAFQKDLQDVEELYTSLTGEAMTNFTVLHAVFTTQKTSRWQKNWDTPPFSGVLPMSTGSRISSPPEKKLFRNC